MENYKVEALDVVSSEVKVWLFEKLQDFGISREDIICVTLHGSHAYGLQRPESDIDLKVVTLPSKEDLVLGNVHKNRQIKNEDLDVEAEIIPLQNLIKGVSRADTNTLDIMFAPPHLIVSYPISEVGIKIFKGIQRVRTNMFNKKMRGLVGYIKTQTAKYTHKIERYNELQEFLDSLNVLNMKLVIEDSPLPDWIDDRNYKYIKNIVLNTHGEQDYVEVCGKKIIQTWTIGQLTECVLSEIKRYGKRTEAGSNTGMDTKAFSHSLRVVGVVREIVEDRHSSYPLKHNLQLLRDIKMGVETDSDKIVKILDEEFEEVMGLLENSDLPDEVNMEPFTQLVFEAYGIGG